MAKPRYSQFPVDLSCVLALATALCLSGCIAKNAPKTETAHKAGEGSASRGPVDETKKDGPVGETKKDGPVGEKKDGPVTHHKGEGSASPSPVGETKKDGPPVAYGARNSEGGSEPIRNIIQVFFATSRKPA